MRAVLCALLLSACSSEGPNSRLADLDFAGVTLSTQLPPTDEASAIFTLSLNFDVSTYLEDHGECAHLGPVEATLSGHVLELDAGGADEDGRCRYPAMTATLASDLPPVLVLELADDSLQVHATYETVPLLPRRASLLQTDWRFNSGEQIAIEWSHANDLTIVDSSILVKLEAFTVEQHYRGYPVVTVIGSSLLLQIPDALPSLGIPGMFSIEIFSSTAEQWRRLLEHGDASSCEGVLSCVWVTDRVFKHSFDFPL